MSADTPSASIGTSSPVKPLSGHQALYPPVSAVIITYNEEKNIRNTLSQLYWCAEIVIIDSYSSDATLAICQEFNCKIFQRTFDGYGPQKKFAVSQAQHDWVLCIDADEVLTDQLVTEIIANLSARQHYAGFAMPMNLVFLDKEFKYGKESGRYFLRLFNKQLGGFSDDRVHESIQVNGAVKKLQHTIRHFSYISVQQYLEKSNRYSTYSAEIAFARGKHKSLLLILIALPFNFFKYYLLELNCLNGSKGFYWAFFSTCHHLSKDIKLRQLYQEKNRRVIPA